MQICFLTDVLVRTKLNTLLNVVICNILWDATALILKHDSRVIKLGTGAFWLIIWHEYNDCALSEILASFFFFLLTFESLLFLLVFSVFILVSWWLQLCRLVCLRVHPTFALLHPTESYVSFTAIDGSKHQIRPDFNELSYEGDQRPNGNSQ